MRNSSFNKRCRALLAVAVLSGLIISVQTGFPVLAEETGAKTMSKTVGKPDPHGPVAGEASKLENLTPDIIAFYDKYGGYCNAIVDTAREQRYALKRSEIEALSKGLQKKIELADAKSSALETWVKRREEFAKQATAKIVEIYANMRPEASAVRLQQLDINLAASLLLAIPPRQASPILNEMDEKTAAAITAVMAASARMDDPS
jgi:flagellar motility protein MotE (MotC chaperone)